LRGERTLERETVAIASHDEDGEQRHDREDRTVYECLAGDSGRPRKKRKRFGEDDTDFEMRLARERSGMTAQASLGTSDVRKSTDVQVVGPDGHISLFDAPAPPRESNDDAEKEKSRKKREVEDQYRMRFTNAAERDGKGLMDGGPWYVKSEVARSAEEAEGQKEEVEDDFDAPTTDAFGRDDPGRKAREVARISSNDPLAMMKRGAAKVREVKAERKKFAEEKAREVEELKMEGRRREKRRQRHKGRGRLDDVDNLEGFSLDAPPREDRNAQRKDEQRHRSEDRRGHKLHDSRYRDRGRRSRSPSRRSRHDEPYRHHRDHRIAT
jgi:hypothetical protein